LSDDHKSGNEDHSSSHLAATQVLPIRLLGFLAPFTTSRASEQKMLDLYAEHGISSDIELIKIRDINQAYERLAKSDVKYRLVIDMASLK
jgi:D-arabinose 1-dehydrogenase-like Zn-dependent alcohol dehydrogenase